MKKKSEGNLIQEDALEEVSGGKKDRVHTTIYNRETEGNYNVLVGGNGEQLLKKFDELYANGSFDNLKK